MSFVVYLITAFIVLMPVFHVWRLWRLREESLAGWAIVAADAVAFCAFLLLIGRWDIAGYYTRALLVALLFLAVVISAVRHRGRPCAPNGRSIWRTHWQRLPMLAAFAGAAGYAASGLIAPQPAKPLAFPLGEGWYMAAQGGGNALLNYHYGHARQSFAADLTGLSRSGFRAAGLMPERLEDYAIFGKPVLSPCAGRVVEAVDGHEDQMPPERDREHPAGNHVIVECQGLQVELAHFQKGSVLVEKDGTVALGAQLGRVGNSGNTTEPHLHIHATDSATGAAVPVLLDGVFPARGRTYGRSRN